MIERLMSNLLEYMRDEYTPVPVLATFTSKFPRSLKGKFLLLRYWKKFYLKMTTELPYREYSYSPLAYAFEYSENAVHCHAALMGNVNSRAINHAWRDLNLHDLGRVDIRPFDTYKSLLSYVFKGYLPGGVKDKFIGHYAFLQSERFSTHSLK